jgi:hypothetical protein
MGSEGETVERLIIQESDRFNSENVGQQYQLVELQFDRKRGSF